MQYPILGIDIGATTVKYALLQDTGVLTSKGTQRIRAASNAEFISQLQEIVSLAAFQDARTVGIGSPGPLDLEKGTIISSANLPAIKDCAIVGELQNSYPNKAFRLDNDANAATLGARFFGKAKDKTDFALFTLGTGVGGGCFWQNQLVRGYRGNAFEVGHIPVAAFSEKNERQGRLCGCGNYGCAETYASATGIQNSYKNLTGASLTAKEIGQRARSGDSHAIEAFNLAGHVLGLVAATITQTLNLTDFILTGGVAASEDLLRPAFERAFLDHTLPVFHALLSFVFTEGDEDAGIFGAAALFLEKIQ